MKISRKTLVVVFTVVIMILCWIMATGKADGYNDYRDDCWFELKIDAYNRAIDEGEYLSQNAYLYDWQLWGTEAVMYITNTGYEGSVNRDGISDMEEWITDLYVNAGVKYISVQISFAGQTEDGKDVFDVDIWNSFVNLNEFEDEVIGNGFVKEGIEYYGMRMLCTIE